MYVNREFIVGQFLSEYLRLIWHHGAAISGLEASPLSRLWCRTRWRPCQPFWKFRLLIDTGCIHLVLGEIFCSYEIRPLEVGLLEVSVLEVGLLEVSVLELGLLEVSVLELGLQEIG